MASDLPAALIPAAFGTALLERLRPRQVPPGTARFVTLLALAGGTGAVITGWLDWVRMPRAFPAWKTGTVHGIINSGSLMLVVGALRVPRRRLTFLAGAFGGVLVAGWLGGDMVFHHGWRVRPAEEFEIVAEALRGTDNEEVIQEARRRVDKYEREETFHLGGGSAEADDQE
jgi:hypothetical protein